MVNRVLPRKLGRDLRQRWGPIASLLLIVMVGVGCFVGMASVWRDLDGARTHYYAEQRLADFTVDLKRAPAWVVESVTDTPNVETIQGRISVPALLDLPSQAEPISGTAISLPTERRPVLNDVVLRSGTWFSGEREKEAILNEAFARENGLVPGSRIKALLPDGQHELLVVGTAMSPEFIYLLAPGGALAPDPARFGVMYLPEDFLRKRADLEGAYNQLVGLAHDASRTALRNTLDLLANRLDDFGVTNTTPVQDQPSARFLADDLKGLKVSATVMPGIFLGVAALVLNVLMARMVAQQRSIIGTLKALGYSRAAVTRHYLGYGAIIGIAGGLLGLGFAVWIHWGMLGIYREFYPMPEMRMRFHPDFNGMGIALCLSFSLLGTYRGVRLAARLEPAEAMHPPPPEKGGRILLERIGGLWRMFSFRQKLILRTVFRNPFRSGVIVLAATLSAGLIFSTLAMVEALDYMMEYEFKHIARQDVTIQLRDPVHRDAAREIVGLPAMSRTEPQLQVVCDVRHGPHAKRIGVTGLPAGNELYTPLDKAGEPVVVPERGLILSKKLAEILDVEPGGEIRLRPLLGRRREVIAPVNGVVETFLGLSAYADIEYLSRLLGEEQTANVLLGRTYSREVGDGFLNEIKTFPTVVGMERRIRAFEQLDATFGQTMGQMISIMVLFAGLIAFGSVLNAALVSMSERQREVGTLRILGYRPGQVAGIFYGESLLLNGIGIALGLGLGVVLTYLLARAYSTELYRFQAVIRPWEFHAAVLLTLLFIGLAQLILYVMIRRFQWKEVLNVRE